LAGRESAGREGAARERRPTDREARPVKKEEASGRRGQPAQRPAEESDSAGVEGRGGPRGGGRGDGRGNRLENGRAAGRGNAETGRGRDGRRRGEGRRRPEDAAGSQRGDEGSFAAADEGAIPSEGPGVPPGSDGMRTRVRPFAPDYGSTSDGMQDADHAGGRRFDRETVEVSAIETAEVVGAAPGTMAAAVAEIVNTEVTLAGDSADAPAARSHRRRRGGRGRGGRGRGEGAASGPGASPAANPIVTSPKAIIVPAPKPAREAPKSGNTRPPSAGRAPARSAEAKAKPAKGGGRPRGRRGPGPGQVGSDKPEA
jgi:hypothetical protein